MKRIALCISGEIRTWDNKEITGISPEETVLIAAEHLRNKGYTVDIFGSRWDYCKKIDTSKFRAFLYNDATNIKTWMENDFYKVVEDYEVTANKKDHGYTKNGIFNAYGQIWNVLAAYQLAGPTYDIYIRLRFDSIVNDKLDHLIEHMLIFKEPNVPIVNLPGLIVTTTDNSVSEIEMQTDLIALVDTDYWHTIFGTHRTINTILKDMYSTIDNFAKFHTRIYTNISKITYISTVSKLDAPTLHDRNSVWYQKLDDFDKFNAENRPI